MAVCTAKPDSLPNLADIGMVGDDGIPARGETGLGTLGILRVRDVAEVGDRTSCLELRIRRDDGGRGTAQALVEARESLNATGSIPSPSAPSTPSTSSAPTFLPAKPR
jgi:hypothetical protein